VGSAREVQSVREVESLLEILDRRQNRAAIFNGNVVDAIVCLTR